MELDKVIKTRRSVRQFADKEVSMKDILACIEAARLAPSACNSQPWNVDTSENELCVFRYFNKNKRGIMPKNKVAFYNQIDIGIFLCFLELCLNKNEIKYKRQLFTEENNEWS